MNEVVYRRLANHLDTLPGGFRPSSTGADLRLLEMLFTPEEAGLAVHLTLDLESAETIAARAGLGPEAARPMLDEMAQKGTIASLQGEDGTVTYQAAPMVVGIYEFQVNRLSEDLMFAFGDYWRTQVERPEPETIPQMRTIPVGQSIDTRLEALTYEQVGKLVESNTRFAVAPCICRRAVKMFGGGCGAPEESCLVFGEWADFYVRTGRGREIDRAEMLALIDRADKANLVLQPSNSQSVDFICCCCGCCCGVLNGLKNHPRPTDRVASAFTAVFDADACEGCLTCVDRCQMDALVEGKPGLVVFKAERCIGCGLCVTTCPSGALALARKPESERTRVPETMNATWHRISEAQQQARG